MAGIWFQLIIDVERTTRMISKLNSSQKKVMVCHMSGAFQTPEGLKHWKEGFDIEICPFCQSSPNSKKHLFLSVKKLQKPVINILTSSVRISNGLKHFLHYLCARAFLKKISWTEFVLQDPCPKHGFRIKMTKRELSSRMEVQQWQILK